MRAWRSPCSLTREDAERLRSVLIRSSFDGSRTVRHLRDRHHFGIHQLEAAAAVGIIRIEKRQPHVGRPAVFAVLEPDGVNKGVAAKLPLRSERPLTLSFREKDFLREFMFRRGSSFFGPPGTGSAAYAYRKVYDRKGQLRPGSVRSAGARLARQPWMRAAFFLDRRMLHCGGRKHWPDDLRSAGREWLQRVP